MTYCLRKDCRVCKAGHFPPHTEVNHNQYMSILVGSLILSASLSVFSKYQVFIDFLNNLYILQMLLEFGEDDIMPFFLNIIHYI